MRHSNSEWTTHDERKYFLYLIEKYSDTPRVILKKLLRYKDLMFVKGIRHDWGLVDKYKVLKSLDHFINKYSYFH